MIDFLFYKRHFFADLFVSVACGAYLGYSAWESADSGGPSDPDELIRAAVVCGAAFFIALLVSTLVLYLFPRFPSFLPIVILGPLFFGFSYRGITYIDWLNGKSFSIVDFIADEGGYALALALVYGILFSISILVARTLKYAAITLVMKFSNRPKLS